MKFLASAALLAVLSIPLVASAQQYPTQAPQGGPAQGQQQVPRIYQRWSNLLNGLNLSNEQHDQIQNLLDQYSQAHPAGSPHDPQAQKALRQQIFAVLNQQQQDQLRGNMRTMREQQLQRRLQRMQQQQPAPAGSQPVPITTNQP